MRALGQALKVSVNGTVSHYPMRAWTGGDMPQPERLTPEYRNIFESLRCQLYRESWAYYVEFWRMAPVASGRAIFWERATHDAWRTLFPSGV